MKYGSHLCRALAPLIVLVDVNERTGTAVTAKGISEQNTPVRRRRSVVSHRKKAYKLAVLFWFGNIFVLKIFALFFYLHVEFSAKDDHVVLFCFNLWCNLSCLHLNLL